jgi:hypothetical protein
MTRLKTSSSKGNTSRNPEAASSKSKTSNNSKSRSKKSIKHVEEDAEGEPAVDTKRDDGKDLENEENEESGEDELDLEEPEESGGASKAAELALEKLKEVDLNDGWAAGAPYVHGSSLSPLYPAYLLSFYNFNQHRGLAPKVCRTRPWYMYSASSKPQRNAWKSPPFSPHSFFL